MNLINTLGTRALRQFDPERAHGLSIHALRAGLVPLPGQITSPRLRTQVAGLDLDNPLGLAAGYDKNAEAIAPLTRAGFGFIEVGAATPRPQPGNPKPRLFRLTEDRAVINRFGFNNDGADAIASRLAKRPSTGTIGLNLGANKDSDDRPGDFAKVLQACGAHLDFATVNVSSPNTEKLRDLQGRAALTALLNRVQEANAALQRPLPIFLKIAPDLTPDELSDIATSASETNIAAIIATNTTLDRHGLKNASAHEKGGLSGAPLFEKSTRILAQLAAQTDIPLIGVGGISTADQAYAKIRAGASALQLYSGLIYGSFSLIPEILEGLEKRLIQDGFASVADAVGTDINSWL